MNRYARDLNRSSKPNPSAAYRKHRFDGGQQGDYRKTDQNV